MSPGEESSERRLSERVGTNIVEDWRIVGEMVRSSRSRGSCSRKSFNQVGCCKQQLAIIRIR